MTDEKPEAITINSKPHVTLKGLLKIVQKAGLDTEQLEKRLAMTKEISAAWLLLAIAVDLGAAKKINEAIKELFFALGTGTCEELDDGQLKFTGVGRLPGCALFVKAGLEGL
jgi:hypothetical protein